jgi:protein-tyrosine phosphatase
MSSIIPSVSYHGQHAEILCETAQNKCELPFNFRFYKRGGPSSSIDIAVSAQFSENQLKTFLNIYKPAKVQIFDVREESHLFINGRAITISNGIANNANRSIEQKAISAKNKAFVQKVIDDTRVTIHTNGEKKKTVSESGETIAKFMVYMPIEVDVKEAKTEETLAAELDIGYVHIPITDHEEEAIIRNVDTIVNRLMTAFRETRVLYFHCKKGVGRSAHLGIMATILLEAKEKSFVEIKGDYEKEKDMHKWELIKLDKREKFFTHFHQYCSQTDPTKETFQSWMMKNNLTMSDLQPEDRRVMGPNGVKIKAKKH